MPFDLSGPLIAVSSLLQAWIENHVQTSEHKISPSKHSRSAEVFPLPMPARDESLSVHVQHWFEVAVKALNWLAVGQFAFSTAKRTERQETLLGVLLSNLKHVSGWELQVFDKTPIEEFWRTRSINGYGEEVHCACNFSWENVKHSLPCREVAGVLDAADVATGGVKDFLENPLKYLKPESMRSWMKCPRVMVSESLWEEGLVERGIRDVIPLSEVFHVEGGPFWAASSVSRSMRRLMGFQSCV